MKTRLTLIYFVCVTLLTPAYSAVKCIPHTSYPSCWDPLFEPYQTDWLYTCRGFGSTNTDNIIKGVGFCSNQYKAEDTISDSITFSSNISENAYCWCKMLSPVVSKWISTGDYVSTYEDCIETCTWVCTDFSLYNPPFIFNSSFSD